MLIKFLLGLTAIILLNACSANQPTKVSTTNLGKEISFQRNKGNCLACHVIQDGEDPGNIAPALFNIQKKFTNKQQLKALLWDATQFNPNTSMPPFGKHQILTRTIFGRSNFGRLAFYQILTANLG